eukprot:COSAG01_NODE_542_length_15693_cov_13.246253_14_plen_91_part_00
MPAAWLLLPDIVCLWAGAAAAGGGARAAAHSNAINLRIPPEPGALHFREAPKWSAPGSGIKVSFLRRWLPADWVGVAARARERARASRLA